MLKNIFLFLIIFICSCTSKKNVVYFDNIENYPTTKIDTWIQPSTIQINDILKIDVTSTFLEAAAPYNRKPEFLNPQSNIEVMRLEGYLISENYTLDFPVLGLLSVKGKTLVELSNEITEILISNKHLSNPLVSVRLLNKKFTVLGEVNKPGTFNIVENELSLLQAIGHAGGLTLTAKRTNVSLVRESDGLRVTKVFDLTSLSTLDHPNFYIHNNDVIIVNPNYNRIKSGGFIGSAQSIQAIASLFFTLAVLLTNL